VHPRLPLRRGELLEVTPFVWSVRSTVTGWSESIAVIQPDLVDEQAVYALL